MPKDRVKQKQNRQRFLMEEKLLSKNEFNKSDPTPKEAVGNIISSCKQ